MRQPTGPVVYREKLVLFLILALFLIFAGVLFQKSIILHSFYLAKAESQYKVKKETPLWRGEIYSQEKTSPENTLLATNIVFYDLLVVHRNVKDKIKTARELAKILNRSEKEIFEKINNKALYIPPLARKLSAKTAEKIEKLNLKGVHLVPQVKRFWPEKKLAAHLLGFVDAEGKGRYGVEEYYDSILQSPEQAVFVYKSQLPKIAEDLKDTKGATLYLTIDSAIQYMTEKILREGIKTYQARSGSAIVVEPQTGKILAMAAIPNFDLNKYNKVKDYSLFLNPNISLTWEPGSVFKPVCMAAALDLDKVTPDTTNIFGSSTKVGPYTIRTATGRAYGKETMTQVLENSDNVAMVWVANLIGKKEFFKYIKKFGFGSLTGIDLAGETAGEVKNVKSWGDIHLATFSFGQGLTVTPLQMLMAFATIANSGKLMKPFVVEKIVKPNGETKTIQPHQVRQVIKEETAKELTQMLVSVVENGFGKKARVPGYKIAGKTGTAQVPNPNGTGYSETEKIVSFAGFAPADNPRFAAIIKLDYPQKVKWASDSAAPLFGKLARWLLYYLGVPPS